MRFNLVDRITELEPGRRIRTIKSLTLAEEYLADHFRTYPVMPGVLMLECMAQSAAWLERLAHDFAYSLVFLKSARNVTYKSFMTPGQVLTMDVECHKLHSDYSEYSGRGYCGDREMVKGRIVLGHANVAGLRPELRSVDHELIAHARSQFSLIGGHCFVPATPHSP